jgi:hypothetical protein
MLQPDPVQPSSWQFFKAEARALSGKFIEKLVLTLAAKIVEWLDVYVRGLLNERFERPPGVGTP